MTERVFAALRDQAALALAAGQSVIVDAVHRRPEEREALAAVAATLRVPFTGVWLDAPLDTAVERVSARRDDASDATAAIVARQAAQPTGPIDWARIDSSGSVDDAVSAVLARIDRTRGRRKRLRGRDRQATRLAVKASELSHIITSPCDRPGCDRRRHAIRSRLWSLDLHQGLDPRPGKICRGAVTDEEPNVPFDANGR